MSKVCIRQKDGATFPFTVETARKPGFVTVLASEAPTMRSMLQKAQGQVELAPVLPVRIEDELAGYSDATLRAMIGDLYPALVIAPDASREHLLEQIAIQRRARSGASPVQSNGSDVVESRVAPPPPNAPAPVKNKAKKDVPLELKGQSLEQLRTMAAETYGYELPADCSLDDAVATLQGLKAEAALAKR